MDIINETFLPALEMHLALLIFGVECRWQKQMKGGIFTGHHPVRQFDATLNFSPTPLLMHTTSMLLKVALNFPGFFCH